MVYKKIEYREFNSLEEIVRWEELNLDKKYKAIRGDLIYSHDPDISLAYLLNFFISQVLCNGIPFLRRGHYVLPVA